MAEEVGIADRGLVDKGKYEGGEMEKGLAVHFHW